MTAESHEVDWAAANQRCLTAELAVLRRLLRGEGEGGAEAEALQAARAIMPAPSSIDALCEAFRLSAFERAILLLCAGVELDSAFAAEVRPTFSLALASLPAPHWSALLPTAPLRHWRLIEFAGGELLTSSTLRIDERILHHLAGLSYLDERLRPFVKPVLATGASAASHERVAERVSSWLSAPDHNVLELVGADSAAKRAVVATAASKVGLRAFVLQARDIAASATERETFIRVWERENVLGRALLLIDCENEVESRPSVEAFVRQMRGPVALATRSPLCADRHDVVKLEVRKPDAAEQRQIWAEAVGTHASALNGQLDAVTAQFSFSTDRICAAGSDLRQELCMRGEDDPRALIWEVCRRHARGGLEHLAQRIESAAGWDDLVLPVAQRELLREMALHLRQRTQVYERWGFAAKSSRGLGLSALFAGGSGTGKTMAAEVLARELQLDLYRIDLASTVSKYIGETEKNLRRLFDAAEESGAILLFDEADALFGKRSDVKDSHDRYANIEVSYLLQRMESYRGLAILTTNRKEALDPAFLRRIRFVVQFPFPDAEQRREIWSRIFPAATPTSQIELEKLSRLNMPGGNIRNIALNAAFLAAEAGDPVGMPHLLRAARSEYDKLEKPLTEAELGGWQ